MSEKTTEPKILFNPDHPTLSYPSPPQSGETGRRGRERKGLAGSAEENRAKPLNVPQQQHRELRRGQPACAPVRQFTGPE